MFRMVAVAMFMAGGWLAQAQLAPWDAAARDAWWAENKDPARWMAAASGIHGELLRNYQTPATGELAPEFLARVYHLRWITLVSAKDFAGTGLTVEEFRALGENEVLARTLLNERSSRDNTVEALKILGEIQRANPEDIKTYPRLAVAYALVFDKAFPEKWPHHQAKDMNWAAKSGTAAERFAYYAAADKKKQLDFSPADLSFLELKFVVDSLTSREELDWAREQVKTSLGGFDRVFSFIQYDTRRLLNREYVWPSQVDYTLAEIQQRGGICVDQAYFGATVGKARGIPTLYFSGQGASGGHAWYGYLKRNHSWDLDVGRYENQNYPVGEARDPQTWEPLNDQELKQFSELVAQNPRFPAAESLFSWSRLLQQQPSYKATLDQVKSMVPDWIEVWRAESAWMEGSQQPLETQKEFYKQWSAQFAKFPDLRVEGQARYLRVLEAAGDTETARQVKAEVVKQNRRKRFDIGIGAAGMQIFDLLEQKNWEGAEKEYKKVVRQFDDKGGGNLYYSVVQPYVETMLEEGQVKFAEEGLEFAEKKMPQGQGSILLKEFEELSDKVKSAKVAGQPRR